MPRLRLPRRLLGALAGPRKKPSGHPPIARHEAAAIGLADSERRLRNAMRLTKLGYYIWDLEKRRNI